MRVVDIEYAMNSIAVVAAFFFSLFNMVVVAVPNHLAVLTAKRLYHFFSLVIHIYADVERALPYDQHRYTTQASNVHFSRDPKLQCNFWV